MSYYPDAHFITSAHRPNQFVPDQGVEVAVAGRSNAGKSSAINVILNRRQFARVSKTPGRTQLVNFFALAPDKRLVDLPGYGYAKVSDAMRRHWGELLQEYFTERKSIKGLLLIIDIRRSLTDFDRQMIALANYSFLPLHVLLTKADKLRRGQAAAALLGVRRDLGERGTVQLFSALKRIGVEEARIALDQFFGSFAGEGEMTR